MKKLIFVVAFICLNAGHGYSQTNTNEDFDLFLKKFDSDIIFQRSRTKFPVRVVTKELKGIKIRHVPSEDWKPGIRKGNPRLKFSKVKINNTETIARYSGINFTNDYLFKIEKGKWWFVETIVKSY